MDSASQILDIAERRMRQHGYNAVSYRDIAAEMGIKSASLHYHFPKKVDLGTALVRRYSDNILKRLEAATQDVTGPGDMMAALIAISRFALVEQRLVCLCAVLGAESPGLPDAVTAEVKKFYQTTIAWLTDCYKQAGADNPGNQAKSALALLQGAMIVSTVNDDVSVFEAAAETLLSGF